LVTKSTAMEYVRDAVAVFWTVPFKVYPVDAFPVQLPATTCARALWDAL
jgi:hypothetical protein